MQTINIKKIAKSKLIDAEVLLKNKRYDGAVYVCGYAVELSLKQRICKVLKWTEYPPENNFKYYKSFKTHNLETLLSLTGKEKLIKMKYFTDWSTVASWDPEARYNVIGITSKSDAENMIQSAKTLLQNL